ncbi:YfiT family bacillithiol transferase [Granulicella sibirica]|uniref:DinB-like domain-containing protein n=1 Tax=Granulicella sibirica TaxID=2479048 RepID=A0A4V1L6C9_9BACT|nr:bacillithiol transferase BstA [Granulicella sibirica]RXH58824.1 hypothetical protein GRAN_2134 [Granulicella sibirica]
MTDLRYPIGPAQIPNPIPQETLFLAMADIADLPAKLTAAVEGLDDAQLDTPYREGGWTVRQVVHHVADSHMHAFARIRFALTEPSPTIMPYDEAAWANLADYAAPIDWSLELLEALHARWVMLLQALTEEQWKRNFLHPENGSVGLEQAVLLYSWHSRHHTAHITRLRETMGW